MEAILARRNGGIRERPSLCGHNDNDGGNSKFEIRNSKQIRNSKFEYTMKLACADFAFPLLEHGKVLDLIAALDFEGVDIGLFEGRSHLWPSKEFRSLSRSAKALKKKLDRCGLACADVFLQMAPSFVPYAINQPEAARRRKARDCFLKTLEY